MSIINFDDRKKKMSKKKTLAERWGEVDVDAASRGAAILLCGKNENVGKVNYSFTMNRDIAELRKLRSCYEELQYLRKNDPVYKKAEIELWNMLDQSEGH